MSDPVNHPVHYRAGSIETIDVIECFELGFHLGNTVKYVLRAGRKGPAIEDLRKARWYLDREIANREAAPLSEGIAQTIRRVFQENERATALKAQPSDVSSPSPVSPSRSAAPALQGILVNPEDAATEVMNE